jgi:thiamine pyrophosphate-dependent acetolactate synthase large subunit-like protein
LNKPKLNFELLAKGQGVDAVRVEHVDQIDQAIERALREQDKHRPFLIDLVLSSDL